MKSKKKPRGSEQPTDIELRKKVLSALEDNKYKFRTLRGISKSADTTPERVIKVIAQEGRNVVISARKSSSGESLYTTRKHYEELATWKEKLMGVILNRVY